MTVPSNSQGVQVIVPAAGLGTRLGYDIPKALVPIVGEPMLRATLNRLRPWTEKLDPIVLIPPGQERAFAESLAPDAPRLIVGGAERQDSVRIGLEHLPEECDVALIHDAARPFPSLDAIASAIDAALESGGATLAVPCADTILVGDATDFLEETPDRSGLWACQTPQVFRADLIRDAHQRAKDAGLSFTDDATLARHFGIRVKLIPGTRANMKITSPEDLAYAEFLAGQVS